MNGKDQMDELIKEIALENGVAVSREDPIMILHTINNRLLKVGAEAQQEQLDQYKSEMEDFANRWGNDAKDKAERILNASLMASKEAMSQILHEGGKAVIASVRGEVDDALACIAVRIREARQICLLNMAASCITLLAAAIALWANSR